LLVLCLACSQHASAQVVTDSDNDCDWRALYARGTWQGTFNQFEFEKYPIRFMIERVEGCDFTGTILFPDMDGETKFAGSATSPNTLILHENKYIKGVDLVIDGKYYFTLETSKCGVADAQYRWPTASTFDPKRLRGQPGGSVTISQSKRVIKSGTPKQERQLLADLALDDWKKRGVDEDKSDFQNRVTEGISATKEKMFYEDALTWVGMQRLHCFKIQTSYASDSGQLKFHPHDYEEIYLTMSAEEAKSIREHAEEAEIRNIEFEEGEGADLKIVTMEIYNPDNEQTYYYPEPEADEDDTPWVEDEPENEELEYHEREVDFAKQLKVRSREIKLEVYDKTTPDGDVVSIQLNGEWLLKNHEVSKKREMLSATLKQGENILIIHADSEGKIPPNSAAVTLIDGTRKYHFTISSTVHKSGAVRLFRK
jgi:hypothetical protein